MFVVDGTHRRVSRWTGLMLIASSDVSFLPLNWPVHR